MEIFDLSVRPDERAAVLSLMEAEFPKGEAQTEPLPFEEEFGALLKDNDPSRILFAAESLASPRPLAALGWKSFTLKQGLKIAAIGLVVTDAAHRKKGLSRALLQEAEARAKDEGCALVCLWSDLLEFYTKLGYTLAGSEIGWDLASDEAGGALGSTLDDVNSVSEVIVREARAADLPLLAGLYRQNPVGPQRDIRVFERQLKQSDTLALVAQWRGAPIAYALAGKGRDLRNVVHEIGGDVASYATLLSEMKKRLTAGGSRPPQRFQFPFSHPAIEIFEDLFGDGEQGAVCFAKVLDVEAFIAALNEEFAAQELTGLRLRHMPDINAWALSDGKQDIFLSPDPSHLLQIFCHPWNLEDLEGLPGRTLKRLEGWRPYPLYFWGPDGV
jgi:GNAT superfamily N-acetyltransferase